MSAVSAKAEVKSGHWRLPRGESIPHRSRVTPHLGLVDLSPDRIRPIITAQVSRRSANCLLIAGATADPGVLAIGSNLEVTLSYTRRFVEGPAAAFEGRQVEFFAALTDLNEVKPLLHRKGNTLYRTDLRYRG